VGGNNADFCSGAPGPRPITGVASPGTTVDATIDDVNGGYCGVEINTPGIWWWVNGTGEVIRASSCHQKTQIKTKISVFTGSCGNLRCVTGDSRPDYECSILDRNEEGAWGTLATAIDFPTFKGQHYFILVQQETLADAGTVWMNYRHPELPSNDNCIDAVGPVPRDKTIVDATTEDGSVSFVDAGYCGALDLYPGSWFQVFGTGGKVTVGACSEFNVDGFYFSVYDGANCDELECIGGVYEQVYDEELCLFGPGFLSRKKTTFTFDTRDRNRYYIMVHYAYTGVEKPTSPFRFFVDDGQNGMAGSGGLPSIEYKPKPISSDSDNGNVNSGADSKTARGSVMLASLFFFVLWS